jgi:hypothetical protein
VQIFNELADDVARGDRAAALMYAAFVMGRP